MASGKRSHATATRHLRPRPGFHSRTWFVATFFICTTRTNRCRELSSRTQLREKGSPNRLTSVICVGHRIHGRFFRIRGLERTDRMQECSTCRYTYSANPRYLPSLNFCRQGMTRPQASPDRVRCVKARRRVSRRQKCAQTHEPPHWSQRKSRRDCLCWRDTVRRC
jgi:hypothetical protein